MKSLTKEKIPALVYGALVIIVALWLRVRLFDFASHDFVSFLAPWVEKFRVYGPIAGFRQDFSDYNMPYLYILSFISLFPVNELYLIKAISVVFDFLLAFAAILVVRTHGGRLMAQLAAMTLALLAPTVWLNSAMWAQCDSLYVSLLLLAYWAVMTEKTDGTNRPILSFILSGLAFSFKLQTIFFLPVYILFWMRKQVRFKHFFVFPAVYLASILPALAFGKPLSEILGVYFQQVEQYSYLLNLNSPSAFAFLPSDVENAGFFFRAGIFAAALLILGVFLYGWTHRETLTDDTVLLLTYLLVAGIPFLLPSMHDRYFYLADQFSLILLLIWPKLWPVAPLTVTASYSAYHAYLFRQYLFYGGMQISAFLLLLALVCAATALLTVKETVRISPLRR